MNPMTAIPTSGSLRTEPGEMLGKVRAESPLVQCIQNPVAMDISANALLAVGASPAMVTAVEESGPFMQVASALSVNMGGLTSTRCASRLLLGIQVACSSLFITFPGRAQRIFFQTFFGWESCMDACILLHLSA